jgi:hypothetical protein
VSSASVTSSQNQSEDNNTSHKLVWAWQYWDNGWYNYDKEASNLVEATYQEYLKNPGITDVRAVKSGEWTYQVDFRQMLQTNIEVHFLSSLSFGTLFTTVLIVVCSTRITPLAKFVAIRSLRLILTWARNDTTETDFSLFSQILSLTFQYIHFQ